MNLSYARGRQRAAFCPENIYKHDLNLKNKLVEIITLEFKQDKKKNAFFAILFMPTSTAGQLVRQE